MRKGIVFIGFIFVLLGGVLVVMRSLSSGDLSMSGILDRLRLSYPDRSGKEANQVLSTLNLLVIIIGGLMVTLGVILPKKKPERSYPLARTKNEQWVNELVNDSEKTWVWDYMLLPNPNFS